MTSEFTPRLPLVSIVIINWNYGRYLAEALQSVVSQDYANFECYVVDNGSKDDSLDVISRAIEGDPRFHLVAFEDNFGQLGAFFKIFPKLAGTFVTILDADDILSNSFLSNHVQVHLALPKPVAFTSANVIEMNADGRVSTGGYQSFGGPLPWNSPALVEVSAAQRVPTISERQFDRLSTHVCTLSFLNAGWFWAPGSANMYRASALRVIQQIRQPEAYMRAADAYLNPFCHALGGSALLDMPLSFYRIHDSNYYSIHETLLGMRSGRPEFELKKHQLAQETVEFIFANSGRFHAILGAQRFWGLLEQVSMSISGSKLSGLSGFLTAFTNNLPILRQTFSDDELARNVALRLRGKALLPFVRSPEMRRLPVGFALRVLAKGARSACSKRERRRRRLNYGIHWSRPSRVDFQTVRRDGGPVAVVSQDPPILHTGIAYDDWIGIAGAYGRTFGNHPAGFLIYPTWSIEDHEKVAAIGHAYREHLRRYSNHRLTYIANTQQETDLLVGEGVNALFLNKNFTVSDDVFRPLSDVKPRYDAVYNARFVPEKRYELAGAIRSLAYLGYLDGSKVEQAEQMSLLQILQMENPHHDLLNPLDDGRPTRLSQAETNRSLNLARVGLCLSEVEGSNYASMEYMLAGLAVVSTPSQGGREVYFDPEFCIVCDPDPESVRRSVEELVARNIPREYIRKRTLEKIQASRQRYMNLVNDMRRGLGGAPQSVTGAWPFGKVSGMVRWDSFDGHLRKLGLQSVVPELGGHFGMDVDVVNSVEPGTQLLSEELAPIARAIRSSPCCRLLVFGCGMDSSFWERINAGGTTVFLEDDAAWLDTARARLSRAVVEPVHYGTRVADWPAQLENEESLMLDLPDHIRELKWDVIIVDGPSGYQPDLPGRARSIYTASKLVAEGGRVFVHDCERPLEGAFAARYLGEHRRVVSVFGRARLDGYAF